MRTLAAVSLLAVITTAARADWKDLKPGMDAHTAWQQVGNPIMENGARGVQIWTYDKGGYVQLEGGVVTCWAAPKPDPRPKNVQAGTEPVRATQTPQPAQPAPVLTVLRELALSGS